MRSLLSIIDGSVKSWATEARILRWLVFLWLGLGIIMLFSSSYATADFETGDGLYYLKRQLVWMAVGLVGFGTLINTPLRYILGMADWLMLLCLGLVILTLVPGLGTSVNGASRWLSVGPLAIVQPSELIKPFLILQSARIFGQWDRLKQSSRLTWLGIFALLLASILLQPNLSTAALCGMSLWLIALAAGLPLQQLGGTAIAGFLVACISIGLRDYQRERVMSFLHPWADPAGDGFQLIQSLLAVGSGGVWGTGFGQSQQKLYYLPIHYTDFIFSVYAEEFGLIGCIALLMFLAIFATLGLQVALKARKPVHQLVAIGAVILLVGQSLLNIGVATGALPTTGLPFPFLSYGGSSMLSSLIIAALLIRVAREGSEAKVLAFPRSPRAVDVSPES
ncbi:MULTISPECIES: FtsW/RodA/SpoVE family cell cycle protein [unclassified Leptolyngbya]|uniref:FtsW/RodA/SpoVE family cell cycle protein n=1 Tax=unclassified Leptolyngbya TaxID=2650499 RepID=UPI001682EBDB|nr:MULTISPECIES: FtsW/RodA/SpoVE family cell cycle protein [unclassified Leptolyngbya]MBD1912457.1 FtsW/RodA/SpoVE family cell cycle protein [Leptolyngbya sp. FACHB-8]MBD2157958.1 FtsW/RodA/SpoVE family cell cycle protein [Leptolyngbya sp. FACHB-16]